MDKILAPIKQRIIQFIDFKGFEKKYFFELHDISASNFRSQSLKSEVGGDVIAKISSHYPELNPEWLITGKGNMIKTIDQKTVEPQIIGKPLIPLDALAGNGAGGFTIMEHDIKEYYNVPEFNHANFMIKVSGASMQPKYYGGDVVACKTVTDWTFFQWNRVYVLDTAQGAIIKRVKQGSDDDHLLLVSENKNYEPFEIAKTDLNGLALVIGVIRLE